MTTNENLTQNGAANSFSRDDIKEQRSGDKVSYKALEKLTIELNSNETYKIPGKKYIHIRKVLFEKTAQRIEKRSPGICEECYPEYLIHPGRGFEPDGGTILLINENETQKDYTDFEPIYSCEMKKQGKEANKDKNNCGNAVERGSKNEMGFEDVCFGESIFPYTIYCWGYDFVKEYMHGKLAPMNHGGGYNKELLHDKKDGKKRTTFYLQIEPYTEEEIYNKALHMVEQVIIYYKEKYQNGE